MSDTQQEISENYIKEPRTLFTYALVRPNGSYFSPDGEYVALFLAREAAVAVAAGSDLAVIEVGPSDEQVIETSAGLRLALWSHAPEEAPLRIKIAQLRSGLTKANRIAAEIEEGFGGFEGSAELGVAISVLDDIANTLKQRIETTQRELTVLLNSRSAVVYAIQYPDGKFFNDAEGHAIPLEGEDFAIFTNRKDAEKLVASVGALSPATVVEIDLALKVSRKNGVAA